MRVSFFRHFKKASGSSERINKFALFRVKNVFVDFSDGWLVLSAEDGSISFLPPIASTIRATELREASISGQLSEREGAWNTCHICGKRLVRGESCLAPSWQWQRQQDGAV
jgi:hypothetical protein